MTRQSGIMLAARSQDTGAKTVQDLCVRLKTFGYGGVQLVAHKTFDDIKGVPDIDQALQIGKALKDANIDIALIAAYFNPVHPNGTKMRKGIRIFREYIAIAKLLGGDTVGSETGSYNGDKWDYNPLNRTPEALDIVVNTFAELCTEGASQGIKVAIEGAAGHCLYSVEHMHLAYKKIVDKSNCDNLRLIFDLYNMLDSDNASNHMQIAEQALNAFGDKIHCFHIKDCFYKSGQIVQVRPGAGELDLKTYLKTIVDYDKNAKLVLEGATGEDIVPAVEFVKNIIEN